MSADQSIPAFDIRKYPDHTKSDDKAGLQFLDDICTTGTYRVHLASIAPGTPRNDVREIRALDIRQQRQDIREFLRGQDGCNLYFSQNESSNNNTMPDEASVKLLRAVTVDIDPLDTTSEEGWQAERKRIKQVVHAAIHHEQLQPAIVIDTGNGAQLVWLLEVTVADEYNKAKLRQVMKALAFKFSGDPKTTHKVSGLFRMPGTCNYPDPSKLARGRHKAYGGIWHRKIERHNLETFAEIALQGAPVDPDQPDGDYTAERIGIPLTALVDAATDLPVTLGYRIADKMQYDSGFRRLIELLQHPSESKDRSGDDFRFAAILIASQFTPAETAMCLAHYGARKAHPIGEKRWVSYIIRTVLNATNKDGKQEDFWVPPEPDTGEASEPPPAEEKPTRKRKWASGDEERDKPLMEAPPLIATLLPMRGLSMMYGDSNTGKSLVALLMCSCVAADEPFGTCNVNASGLAVFVAMEGGGGLHKRVKALAKKYPDRPLDRLIFLTERYSLFEDPNKDDTNNAKALLTELRDIRKTLGKPISLLVIDMLAVAASGANENSGEDMAKVLDRLEIIERECQCHVLILHHTGKNIARGARGWSGLRGRVDTELEIMPPKDISLKMGFLRVSKQRDMDFNPATQFGFRILSILLGHDDERQAITGATIELLEGAGKMQLTETEQELLDIIAELARPVTLTELVEATGKKMPYLTKLLSALIKKHKIFCDNGRPKHYSPMWVEPEEEDAEPVDPFS